MPAATAIALLAIACGLRYRERLLAPVRADAAITAALGGTIAVGVGGALFNDSGPVLLLFATFIAACVVLYVRGDPRLALPDGELRAVAAPAVLEPETPLDAGLASPHPDPAHSAR
jgi:hypothetical protein